MGKESEDKATRVLEFYSKLKQGKVIDKQQLSVEYGVSPRTIQRDIADIQCFLQNQSDQGGECDEIVFDKPVGGYVLRSKNNTGFQGREILAVTKVLLESRALLKNEMFPIIHRLIDLCSDEEEKQLVTNFLRNEMHHYIELQHGVALLERIWELEAVVKSQQCIEIEYGRQKNNLTVTRKIKPVGIMFSEFYFYLLAFIDDINKEEHFKNPDDIYPTIYRVDRIKKVKVLDEHFAVPYKERFEEGEFRKRVQFMYGGKLKKVQFKYKGNSIDFILDRLPTAKIVRKEDDGVIIQAEVFGDGIEMWLRGIGEGVEILQK